MRTPIPPLFGIEKVHKRFSPLKRRSESAASSPHIKLSSVKLSKRLRNLLSSLADAPHCSMGLVSMHKLVDIILALIPCHAAVCVNCALGSNVQFLRVITQSTGHISLPGLPIGKKLGSNSTFMYRKTLCKVVEQCTEYIFVLSFIRLALFR